MRQFGGKTWSISRVNGTLTTVLQKKEVQIGNFFRGKGEVRLLTMVARNGPLTHGSLPTTYVWCSWHALATPSYTRSFRTLRIHSASTAAGAMPYCALHRCRKRDNPHSRMTAIHLASFIWWRAGEQKWREGRNAS